MANRIDGRVRADEATFADPDGEDRCVADGKVAVDERRRADQELGAVINVYWRLYIGCALGEGVAVVATRCDVDELIFTRWSD